MKRAMIFLACLMLAGCLNTNTPQPDAIEPAVVDQDGKLEPRDDSCDTEVLGCDSYPVVLSDAPIIGIEGVCTPYPSLYHDRTDVMVCTDARISAFTLELEYNDQLLDYWDIEEADWEWGFLDAAKVGNGPYRDTLRVIGFGGDDVPADTCVAIFTLVWQSDSAGCEEFEFTRLDDHLEGYSTCTYGICNQ